MGSISCFYSIVDVFIFKERERYRESEKEGGTIRGRGRVDSVLNSPIFVNINFWRYIYLNKHNLTLFHLPALTHPDEVC